MDEITRPVFCDDNEDDLDGHDMEHASLGEEGSAIPTALIEIHCS